MVARDDEAAVAREEAGLRHEQQVELARQPRQRADILGQRHMRLAHLAGRRLQCIAELELLADQPADADAVAQGAEIARPAAADRDTRQGTRDVGRAPQVLADRAAQLAVAGKELNGVVARRDLGYIGERRRQPRGQLTGAGGGDRAVDGRKQASLALAGQGPGQLEIAPRRRVDAHMRLGRRAGRRRESGELAFLRQLQISDERAGGRQFGARELTEAVERRDAVARFQGALARVGIEFDLRAAA